ncbi:MAG TPA: phosphatase PAP2 family protein, partial [Tepidisphaeraceae bacterium]
EHQQEIALLIKLQHDRTPAEIARVTDEEHHMNVFSFADIVSPNFTPKRCPKTAAFFKTTLRADMGYFNKLAKNHWDRPRPYTDPRIHSLFIEKDGSYPSGHSLGATVYAELLAYLLPEHRDALIARSQQIGWDREIAGVHFPTDIYAGRVLGQALANDLLANPDFRNKLDQLRPELQAVLDVKNKAISEKSVDNPQTSN